MDASGRVEEDFGYVPILCRDNDNSVVVIFSIKGCDIDDAVKPGDGRFRETDVVRLEECFMNIAIWRRDYFMLETVI